MSDFVDESKIPEPPVGAHLVSPRLGFNHHGLYAGNGRVIHYSGMARTLSFRDILKLPGLIRYGAVVKTSLRRFCDGHGFRVVEHPHAKFTGEEAVLRAKKRLYERSYYLYGNNCEHFVNWCIDDTFKSSSVTRLLFLFASFGFLLHALCLSNVSRKFPAGVRFFFNVFFAVVGALVVSHFTLDAMQPAAEMRGRERRNRYFGRVGTWCGFALSPLFAILGASRNSPLSGSFFPFFLPVVGGVGTYGIFRLKDTLGRDALRRERKRAAESLVPDEIEADGGESGLPS